MTASLSHGADGIDASGEGQGLPMPMWSNVSVHDPSWAQLQLVEGG